MADQLPELIVADTAAWRSWLRDHHGEENGVWLVLAKKGITEPTSLSYDQALEEAICHGWVDGQLGKRDDVTFRRRFTPRLARSNWSKRNVGIADRMTDAGRMHAAGLLAVRRAKEDGSWDRAYEGQASSEVPPDLAAALAGEPAAQATFEGLSRLNRYAVVYRVQTAKRADTRARRIDRFVAMLARGETVYPQSPKLDE